MLNTLPPSIAPAPPRCALHPPALNRRRGGQPSNRNAFIHGLYAQKSPPRLTNIPVSLIHSRKISGYAPESLRETIHEFQEYFCMVWESRIKTENFRLLLSADKLAHKILKSIIRLKSSLSKQQLPLRNLHFVSKYCLDIIRLNIDDIGISRDADSFRLKFEDGGFTSFAFEEFLCASFSDPPYPFITPRQWRVLEPLLPPPDPIRRRGRPPVDPRELLDAVFWKLAHKARWQDLPDYYPPMLSCRRYYRRLFLSGRFTTLLSALFQDLEARGEATLPRIVQQQVFFTVTDKMLTLPAAFDEIWQLRTALLFLQLGYQAFRRVRRELKLYRRLGHTSCRILSTEKFRFGVPLIKYSDSSYIPLDLSTLDPGSCEGSGTSCPQGIRSADCQKKVTLIQPIAQGFQGTSTVFTETATLSPVGEKHALQFY